MIIQYLSDLHLEFDSYSIIDKIEECESDVVIFAGDIHNSKGIVPSLELLGNRLDKHIIFVTGNHEYYYSTKEYVDRILMERFHNHPKIHILNNSVWEYNGVIFLGSTGWWTTNKASIMCKEMNDYRLIYDIIPAKNGLAWGIEARDFFLHTLKKYLYVDHKIGTPYPPVVCISHNAPSYQSINEKYLGDDLNVCFVNAWEHMIFDYRPKFWIHGHVHDTHDYKLCRTQILCNPYGYHKRGINSKFNPCKTFEIEKE